MDCIIINGEKCLEIIGFERYRISESGRIYRTKSKIRNKITIKEQPYISENKIHFRIRNNKITQGFASLTDNKNKLRNVAVAPLVARAFGIISRKLKKHEAIGYKDGNKKNLYYSNLHIVEKTYSNYKLSLEDIKKIKAEIKKGIPLNKIASQFGVSDMQINRIKTGENWGKLKIKKPVAPFKIDDGKMRRYIATFNHKKTTDGIRKKFTVKRNPKIPTDNTIVGILKGYKLSLKHSNITRAKIMAEKLNQYFF